MRRLFVLVVAGTLMVALAATVASAQPYEAEEIEVTGVLEEVNPNPVAEEIQFVINDEETGAERPLLECGRGAVNNLEDFVGQRVTVSGIPQTQGNPPSSFPNPNEIPLCVTAIELAGDVAPSEDQYAALDQYAAPITPDQGVQIPLLPDTGGLALLPIVGAMLVAGGLLGTRMLRRR